MEPFARLWQRRRRLGRVDAMTAKWFQLSLDDVVVTIHCGSRGLGHQIGTEFLKEMVLTAKLQASSSSTGARLRPDQLGGRRPLPRRHARSNQLRAGKPRILGHYARRVFAHFFPDCDLRLLFDVSHNTCKVEMRAIGGKPHAFSFIARAPPELWGPVTTACPRNCALLVSRCSLAAAWEGSYILVGAATAEDKAFASACDGAGRALSHAALKQWSGRKIEEAPAPIRT